MEDAVILRFKTEIKNTEDNFSKYYDQKQQIWIDQINLLPVVLNFSGRTDFGETVITETGEGTDQTERASASDFGETICTRTHEGIDQSEGSGMSVIGFSEFGETIKTATSEGVDQSEGTGEWY